jgi:leucyl aminopeptidase
LVRPEAWPHSGLASDTIAAAMGVSIEIALPGATPTDVLVLPLADPVEPIGGDGARIVDEKLGGRLQRLAERGDVRGELGRTTLVPLDDELQASRLLVVGVGPREEADAAALRTAGAAAAEKLAPIGGTATWLLDETLALPLPAQAGALVEGMLLGTYDPGRWKTGDRDRRPLERVVVGHEDEPDLRAAVERAQLLAERTNRARDLVNAPPNELTPTRLAEHAAELADAEANVTAAALGPNEITELGMGAFSAVAGGSVNEPRLIVLRYDPPDARADLVLGLVGKAITFDAGGLSIKPAGGMQNMKGDMAGGAAVIEGFGAIAARGTPVRAIAVVASCENLLGERAFRPGDIVRAANGKTIEITNTDAEGRLVLADALWYARREGATHVLDLATLTGAMKIALGDLYAGLFANDDDWRDRILTASGRSGDLVWPFPLHRRYRKFVESTFADLKNSSEARQAGPVYAAEFLREFAGEGPWAHIDMSGPGFLDSSRGDDLRQPGGTGFGVRLIAELGEGLAA